MEELVEIGAPRGEARNEQEQRRQHAIQPTSIVPAKKQIQTSQFPSGFQNTPPPKVARRHEEPEIAIPRSRMQAHDSMVPVVQAEDALRELLPGTRDKSVRSGESLLYDRQEGWAKLRRMRTP
jgi:hypothetical protein